MYRRILTALSAVGAAFALQGVALAQETIKVGLISIDGGPFALFSGAVADGAAIAVDALNAQGGALGRKYELVTQAHAGTPAAAIAAASKLVDQQGVSFFTGMNTSATSLAISSKLPTMNALFVDAIAATDDLTGKACHANYFRIGVNDSINVKGLQALIKDSGIKTWNLLMADYALGHDYGRKLAALIQENGGTVQTTLFAPLATTDFGSFISQLAAKPAEGLALMITGSGSVALAKQQQQFGLFSKYKSVVTAYFTSDIVIGAQGDSTVGLLGSQSYHWAMPGELNAAFVKAYEARYKRKPAYVDADTYMAFQVLHAAILKARSTDVAAVRTALSGLKTSTLVGDIEIRAADHQTLRPLALTVVNKGGEGKGVVALKSVEPASRVAPPVSPDCKI